MTIATIIGSAVAGLGAIAGFAVSVAQLTPPARLRAQLIKDIELYEKLPDDALAKPALNEAIQRKTYRLAMFERHQETSVRDVTLLVGGLWSMAYAMWVSSTGNDAKWIPLTELGFSLLGTAMICVGLIRFAHRHRRLLFAREADLTKFVREASSKVGHTDNAGQGSP